MICSDPWEVAGTTAIPRSHYEAAQQRKGSLNQARALKPGSGFSQPDCNKLTNINLLICVLEMSSLLHQCWEIWPTCEPSHDGMGAAPWAQTLLYDLLRKKGQNGVSLKLLVIMCADKFPEQVCSRNFPQLLCFPPATKLLQSCLTLCTP